MRRAACRAAASLAAFALAPAAGAQYATPAEAEASAPVPAAVRPSSADAPRTRLHADEPRLRFDPFAGGGGGAVSARVAATAPGFVPELRATLVAGPHSSVNLGGVLLGLGEEAHGFRLVEVRPFEAAFDRAGQRVVLSIADEAGEDP